MKTSDKKYFIASSVLIGSCIGAGVLGIPFVAAQAGFFITLAYILIIGILILIVNLYLGEVVLRTKGDHQLIGYVERYLGRRARHVMEFAVIFGAYAALIAYMLGMGESLSYLFFGHLDYEIIFGVLVGLIMSWLLWGGLNSLKKFEKWGVVIILGLLFFIVGIFTPKIVFYNLMGTNFDKILLPFGVVLFALMSFYVIPEVKLILKQNEHRFKHVLFTGTIVSVVFYLLFTWVVVGFKGAETPQVSTLALGGIFIVLGVFTMFTSYLSSGNALKESFQFDERISGRKSWLLASTIPIVLFLLTQLTEFFSFTRILSLGGVVTGGIMAILILLMVRKAKVHGNRNPEYEFRAPLLWLGFLILIFLFGVLQEFIF